MDTTNTTNMVITRNDNIIVLEDIAKSLRQQNEYLKTLCCSGKKLDDEWCVLEMDEDGNILPPDDRYEDYEWVIVKTKDSSGHIHSVPRIARYNSEKNIWISIENGVIYSNTNRYNVAMWRPIPGTSWEDLVDWDNKRVMRVYKYE